MKSSNQREIDPSSPPPDYTTIFVNHPEPEPLSPMDIFLKAVEHRQKLIFHSVSPGTYCTRPTIVQIRDETERPILSIMLGTAIGGEQNRFAGCIQIMSAKGEPLFVVSSSGSTFTVSCGDVVLGILKDKVFENSRLIARNTLGEVIFHGFGGRNIDNAPSYCCCGSCQINPDEFTFANNQTTLARIKKSSKNQSGNELTLFNTETMDPHIKALLIFSSYLTFLAFFVGTPCGRIGERGIYKRICCLIITASLIVMSLPLLILL